MISDLNTLVTAGSNLKDYVSYTVSHYFFKPDKKTGIGGIRLDIVGEQKLSMPTQSTDHYVESNISYQDQVSLPPIVYDIQGEIGELVFYEKDSVQTQVGYVVDKLTPLVSFAPSVSRSFRQAANMALEIAGMVDSVDNIVTQLAKLGFEQKINSTTGETETTYLTQQQVAYLGLISLRNARQPIDITTPWSDLHNYVITKCDLVQPKETKDKTLISLQLKEFRTTDLTLVPFNKKDYQNRLEDQKAPVVNQGQTNGVLRSFLRNTFGSDRQ